MVQIFSLLLWFVLLYTNFTTYELSPLNPGKMFTIDSTLHKLAVLILQLAMSYESRIAYADTCTPHLVN